MDRRFYYPKAKYCPGSCSSSYSTCSSTEENNLSLSRQSEIIAGQESDQTMLTTETTLGLSETNFSINLLDQNIDVILDDNDVFMDCTDNALDLDNNSNCMPDVSNESTIYLPIKKLTNRINIPENDESSDDENTIMSALRNKTFSSELIIQSEPDRLRTIMEETDVFSRNTTLSGNKNNENSQRRVLGGKDNTKMNGEKNKRKSQNNKSCTRRDKNVTNQNTTESFLYWEKICENSEYISQQKKSLADYRENENSKCFRTLDDTDLNNYQLCLTNIQKYPRRRSKSCETLLEEVKHLPHVFYKKYDEFLECLSKEIQEIRKQNVICNCEKKLIVKNNTEIIHSDSTANFMVNKSKSPIISRLSPMKNKSHGTLMLSPSPIKSGISPKKRQYSTWRKEIVSPVGEYIKGRKPSPFKNSPKKNRI